MSEKKCYSLLRALSGFERDRGMRTEFVWKRNERQTLEEEHRKGRISEIYGKT
jgi:hypothetical protein